MPRREFSRATKVEIIKRATRPDGQPACENCGAIGVRLEVHHKDMDAIQIDKSRKLTAADGELLCEKCHDPITSKQRKILAKALAVEAAHIGASRPKGTIANRPPVRVERAHEGRQSLPPKELYR